MTLDEFMNSLDRYGSDLSRWPSELRLSAEQLLSRRTGEAWSAYQAALLVDEILSQPVPAAGRPLLERILSKAQTPVAVAGESISVLDVFSVWQQRLMAGAVFASLLVGVVVGRSESDTGLLSTTVSVPVVSETTSADDIYADVPGLTSSPDDVGGL